MQADFDLVITADTPNRRAEFVLRDAHGAQLAYRATEFKAIAASDQHGLFDLRTYLRHYAAPGEEAVRIAHTGVCIAEQVLGADIFKPLYASEAQRTLRIQLPGAGDEANHLAASLARVPWEIARPSADKPTLGERNLLVRVVHDMAEPPTKPLDIPADETLRVLFVFAEARGSRPLAARKERRVLLELFAKEIYPDRRIEAHFLTHGVTRDRLRDQIQENNGYHVVHWSGHGHLNLLELAKSAKQGSGSDHLSGEALLDLFTDAGGFLPRLFFLSACHSGDILRVKDWNDFAAIAAGKEPATKQASDTKDIPLDEQPGYTGTAHALLQGGVPSVIAMRYAVGDEYARDLAVEFYRALLAHKQPKHAAAALTMARRELLKAKDQSRYVACDHATPVLYGAAQPDLRWPKGRSPALDENSRTIRLHQIAELTTAQHEHFVGRTWELAGLGADFIGSDQQPVAVITGLGGMGKTALTAETLSLWESRFDWVLLYQAKPNALSFETFLRDIHLKLVGELGRYHDHVKARPADAIYRDASAEFTGAERYERLTRNLIRALRDEAILLVLDNFETNLKPHPEADDTGAEPSWACQDAAWDSCLARLAEELKGTRSRVLVTCRQPLAALQGIGYTPVPLGPLPAGEAALYLREHAGLSRMFFSADAGERELAIRLLNASRFHPLLMDRLARLAAGGDKLRAQLLEALDTLERRKDFAQLPALFAARPGDAKEVAYLNDVLAVSHDQLIQHLSPDARRLLWMIAVANEPVELGLLQSVWSGEEDAETQQLRQIKQMLEMLPLLPPELQEQLKALPPEVHVMLDALPPPTTNHRPPATDLLRQLIAVGLVNAERDAPDDENPSYSCHELVRERIRARMNEYPAERDGMTENAIRLGYAEHLAAAFRPLESRDMTAALQAGSRALVYYVQTEAYDRVASFGSHLVNNVHTRDLIEGLLPHLLAAAESAPAGQPRWSCLAVCANALAQAGHPNASFLFYEQADAQARAAAQSAPIESETSHQAWADVSAITSNWANALLDTGDLGTARQKWRESSDVLKKMGDSSPLHTISRELQGLRIDIMQGQTAQALPHVEACLTQLEEWLQEHRSGTPVPGNPTLAFLIRVYAKALGLAFEAHVAEKDWAAALHHIDALIKVEREHKYSAEDIADARKGRADVLGRLSHFAEAQAELEDCLQVFQHDPVGIATTLDSSAYLFAQQGDIAQAIRQERRVLGLFDQLPYPHYRASSHNNLAEYIGRSDAPSAVAEAQRHMLAGFVYRLVAELEQDIDTSLFNYAILFHRAHAAGTPLAVPRVAELLADPAFRPLDDWLRQRQVDVDELQAAVDQLLEQVRQAALGQPTEQSP
jgi:tetratricopeptide (TPR) repeat protein